MTRLGIMQGRLVPPETSRIQTFPRARWEDEFPLAQEAGLQAIECVYDVYGEDVNPLNTDEGLARVRHLSERHGVAVRSICADWFIQRPLVRVEGSERDSRLDRLRWLLKQGHAVGVERVVLPFVDESALHSDRDVDELVEAVEAVLPDARALGIELHLETALAPAPFRDLLDRLPDPLVRVNYDSGNSASLGYDVREEFAAYGDRVGSVHVKDRHRGGGTVPLGTGDADLPAVFAELRRVGYDGWIILQVARDVEGDEVAWTRRNRVQVEGLLSGT